MKIEQLLNEHKKGVKAKIYNKKPKALVGPEALKKKEQQKKNAPPKTELQSHKKLVAQNVSEAHPNQQISRYNPDGDTYRQEPMPVLDKDPVDNAEPLDTLKNEPVETDFNKAELKRLISKNLEDLNKQQKAVLKARYWSDMTYDEIANRFNISIERVRQIEAKSLRMLRGKMKADDYFEDVNETAKLSTREKFKRSLKRAGYDPDAGAKRIEDLLAKQKKEREEREKQEQEKEMKETKQPGIPAPRNFVAKNAKTAGAGKHKDAKKASKEVRGQKHKSKELAEGEWDQQSDEMIPPEYDMDQSELSQIRNAPVQDDDTVAQIVKMSAKGINNDQIANYFDMDQDEVDNILSQNINDVKSQIDETEMGKIVDYKPGQTATLNTGPGMTTIIDLKKNPTSLTKDPTTGKLKLMGPQAQGTPGATSTQPSTIKAGDAVEIGKTTEDILRLAGLK